MSSKGNRTKQVSTGRWLQGLIILGIFVTGVVLWLLLPGEDELPHRLSGVFRRWHGAFAILSTLFIGYMLADHVVPRVRRILRWDGVLHLAVWGVLIVSGYLLYYPQDIISAYVDVSVLHWVIGLMLGAVFPLHVSRRYFIRLFRKKSVSAGNPVCRVGMESQGAD
jgi:hypothetical protein